MQRLYSSREISNTAMVLRQNLLMNWLGSRRAWTSMLSSWWFRFLVHGRLIFIFAVLHKLRVPANLGDLYDQKQQTFEWYPSELCDFKGSFGFIHLLVNFCTIRQVHLGSRAICCYRSLVVFIYLKRLYERSSDDHLSTCPFKFYSDGIDLSLSYST